MDYNSCLDVVKAQNPDMPFKQQQKAASAMLKQFNTATEGIKGGKPPEIIPDKSGKAPASASGKAPASEKSAPSSLSEIKSKQLSINELKQLENQIRQNRIDKNGIISVGQPAIPEGELLFHDKVGVNTLVSFEDKYGNKLPVVGYFKIFIVRS